MPCPFRTQQNPSGPAFPAHCPSPLLTMCLVIGLTISLGAGRAHAQDSTATTQPVVVVLSPMAQAALYQPTSTRYKHLREPCGPGPPRPLDRYHCILQSGIGILAGTGMIVGSIWALTLDTRNDIERDARTILVILFLPMAIGVTILSVIKLVRGIKMPPTPPGKARPLPF